VKVRSSKYHDFLGNNTPFTETFQPRPIIADGTKTAENPAGIPQMVTSPLGFDFVIVAMYDLQEEIRVFATPMNKPEEDGHIAMVIVIPRDQVASQIFLGSREMAQVEMNYLQDTYARSYVYASLEEEGGEEEDEEDEEEEGEETPAAPTPAPQAPAPEPAPLPVVITEASTAAAPVSTNPLLAGRKKS